MLKTSAYRVNSATIKHAFDGGAGAESLTSKAFKESSAFVAAEFGSMGVGLGVVALADILVPKQIMTHASQVVGQYVVEPFLLKPMDYIMPKICKLEECKIDESQSRKERAEKYGKNIIVFGAAYLVGLGSKIWMRDRLNKWLGIIDEHQGKSWYDLSAKAKMIIAADEGVHYGSMLLLNNQMAHFTDYMIRQTTATVHKVTGMEEKKAHDLSMMFWVHDAANVIGAAAGIFAIYGAHKHGWPNGKLKDWLSPKSVEGLSHVERLAQEAATVVSHVR